MQQKRYPKKTNEKIQVFFYERKYKDFGAKRGRH